MNEIMGRKVCASFQCVSCKHKWTTFHARLQPDGETIMGQSCVKCGEKGQATEWHVADNRREHQERDSSGGGMHVSSLCDACVRFGNCMGTFYDPFVLTTALHLITGQFVQWKAFAPDVPELLVADLGPEFEDQYVCLQPHVFVGPSPRGRGTGGRQCSGGTGALGDQNNPDNYMMERNSRNLRIRSGPTGCVQVKDRDLFDNYLSGGSRRRHSSSEMQSSRAAWQRSPGHFSSPTQESYGQMYNQSEFNYGAPAASMHPTQWTGCGGGMRSPSAPSVTAHSYYVGGSYFSHDTSHAPAEERVPRAKKCNKITNTLVPQARNETFLREQLEECSMWDPRTHVEAASSSSHMGGQRNLAETPLATPFLHGLGRLRRLQFLQMVLQHIKAMGGQETEKHMMAEQYLEHCNGDYERAVESVKAMGFHR